MILLFIVRLFSDKMLNLVIKNIEIQIILYVHLSVEKSSRYLKRIGNSDYLYIPNPLWWSSSILDSSGCYHVALIPKWQLSSKSEYLAINADVQFTRKRNRVKDLVPSTSLNLEDKWTAITSQLVECLLYSVPPCEEGPYWNCWLKLTLWPSTNELTATGHGKPYGKKFYSLLFLPLSPQCVKLNVEQWIGGFLDVIDLFF